MLNRKILLLSILFVSLLAISAVSAADNVADEIGIDDTNDDEIVLKENIDKDENEIIAEPDGTFTSLQENISNALPGSTIILEKNYAYDEPFTGFGGIEITNKNNLTIDGNGFTIDAKNKSRIFNVQNSSVVIKNIIFINGNDNNFAGGAIFIESGDLTISNCTFLNNSAAYGGAIANFLKMVQDDLVIENSTISISGCNFTGNNAFINNMGVNTISAQKDDIVFSGDSTQQSYAKINENGIYSNGEYFMKSPENTFGSTEITGEEASRVFELSQVMLDTSVGYLDYIYKIRQVEQE